MNEMFANIRDGRGNLIEYKINKFPAGEVGLLLSPKYKTAVGVRIDCDIFNSNQLMLLIAMIENIENLVELKIGFFAYQRQDKSKIINNGEFEEIKMYKKPFDLIADAIGNRKVKVTFLDIHNSLMNEDVINIIPDIKRVIIDGVYELNKRGKAVNIDNVVIVYPDAGAMDRYGQTTKEFKVISFDKFRGDTGSISEHSMVGNVDSESLNGKDVFIIDDLCDGGRTFTSAAAKIKMFNVNSMSLYVTHGLFSFGVDELVKTFDLIMYSTTPRKSEVVSELKKICFDWVIYFCLVCYN